MNPAMCVVLMVLVTVWQAAAYPCTPSNRASCPKAPGGLATDQVPQFITITWDDAITSQSYSIVESILGGAKQRNGCPVPSTYFITAVDTIPAAVQALYLQGNEIATHTYTHQGFPSAEEITSCREWLANKTGIPKAKINGFRAPYLLHNATTRSALADAGFLYDSSISDTVPSSVSRSLKQRTFPYMMDQGIPQACSTGSCSAGEKCPIWEVPLWTVADERGNPISTMDPPGNALDIYKRELAWRLEGNRAPLGLFFHAGLEAQPERVSQLRTFIQYATSQNDVWFVTNQQLLAWMQSPVPASQVATLLKCNRPRDISPKVGGPCVTFVSDCVFGTFDARKCRCVCMAEGRPGGYCRNKKTGQCTSTC